MFESGHTQVLSLSGLPTHQGFVATPLGGPQHAGASEIEDRYATGFDAGYAAARTEFDIERSRMSGLLAAAQAFRCEPASEIAAMVASAVEMLVVRLTGEAPVSPDWLHARVAAASAEIADADAPRTLRLHPTDCTLFDTALLPFEIVPDETIAVGDIVIVSGATRVEEGRSSNLMRLRAILTGDQM